jgi:Ohr subfamily peroxiredoxin
MATHLLYSAHARAIGGRSGHTQTENNVSFDLEMPKIANGVSRQGATTPEDLFAAGYAACFGSALDAVARKARMPLQSAEIGLIVSLRETDGNYQLDAAFDIQLGGVNQAAAEELVHKAHEVCPYSRATRGNIEVQFKVQAETQAA